MNDVDNILSSVASFLRNGSLWLKVRMFALGVYCAHPFVRCRIVYLRWRFSALILSLGDSHSKYTFAGIPRCSAFHVGAVTMHRVGRDGLEHLTLQGSRRTIGRYLSFKNGDVVFFSFGEIDCRCHIAVQIQAGRSEQEIIQTLVQAYVATVAKNQPVGVTFCIVSVTPPAYEKYLTAFRSFKPTASDADRARYTRLLNNCLQTEAQAAGIAYLDIYTLYVDEQGMLPYRLSDCFTHIKQNEKVRALVCQRFVTA